MMEWTIMRSKARCSIGIVGPMTIFLADTSWPTDGINGWLHWLLTFLNMSRNTLYAMPAEVALFESAAQAHSASSSTWSILILLALRLSRCPVQYATEEFSPGLARLLGRSSAALALELRSRDCEPSLINGIVIQPGMMSEADLDCPSQARSSLRREFGRRLHRSKLLLTFEVRSNQGQAVAIVGIS